MSARDDEGPQHAGGGGQGDERDDVEPDDAERRATEKFVSDLLARGEAVFEGEEPTPRTTHVIERADDGRLLVRRLRFRS
ncbi:hypothetical protein [Streptomyces sp. NPDC005476]|uniref:hypothetical protein n=1 Tax=Streptomyces sp. NPDC005476 TaxID=3156882 RepID=UPI0034544CEC